jgi:hypothetical protein
MKNGLIETRFLVGPSRVESFAAVLVEFMLRLPSSGCVERSQGIELCASSRVRYIYRWVARTAPKHAFSLRQAMLSTTRSPVDFNLVRGPERGVEDRRHQSFRPPSRVSGRQCTTLRRSSGRL